jgi:hypothetical protein
MKSFKEFLQTELEEQTPSRADHKKMRDFTYHHVTNTDKDHPTIKKMFVKNLDHTI